MQEIRTTKSFNFIIAVSNINYEGIWLLQRSPILSQRRRKVWKSEGGGGQGVIVEGLLMKMVLLLILSKSEGFPAPWFRLLCWVHTNPPYLITSNFTVQNLYPKIIHQGLIKVWQIKFIDSELGISKRLNLEKKIGLTFKFFWHSNHGLLFFKVESLKGCPSNAVYVPYFRE